ncbi:MAG TPA: ABC transporter ATP-binding protein, partial [Sulfurospirillum arcachonense]|nr:ABC transporter ATP-binding protein [Sulfurospirillum arcachonense]
PGAVIAIGIIILFGNFDNYLIDNFGFEGLLFSGTLFALLFGYIVRFLAVGLKDINIDLNEGEILTILGASGSGKSTILNLIAGFEKPSSGTIGIYEKIVSSNEEFMEPHTRNVGFVFQNYALFPHLNVFKNISFGISDKETNKQKRVVEEMMKLTGLEGLEKRYPHELSGGQQQRVALARTLATKPKLILFDEAFSNVDAILKSKIEKELLCTT